MHITRHLRHAALAASAVLVLGACASPAGIQAGETVDAAIGRLGRPAIAQPLPAGGERLIWSSQPMGQFAWAAETDSSGRIVSNRQVLTTENFERIQVNDWTSDRLLFEFGPPAEISRVGLRGEHIVWSYRYRQDTVWNSLMYIYVKDGKVERYHPGPDPMAEPFAVTE